MDKLDLIKEILKWIAIYSTLIGMVVACIFGDTNIIITCGFMMIGAIIIDLK